MSRAAGLALGLCTLTACLAPTFEPTSPLSFVESLFPIAPVLAPLPPEAPRMTCPVGWRAEGSPAVCEPWPVGGRKDCGPGEAHFVGEAGCVVVGTACPADGWPTALPADRPPTFVRQGAPAGGDGSRARPFASLQAALAAAGDGAVLALGPGTYQTNGALPQGTRLVGVCVAQTTLMLAPGSTAPAVVFAEAAGIEVRNLRVTGAGAGLAASGPAAQLHVEDVVVEEATALGFAVREGASATGRNLVVRRTRVSATGSLGQGLHLANGGRAALSRVVLEDNRTSGALVGTGASLRLTQAAIFDTQPSIATTGHGVWVVAGGRVELVESVVEDNQRTGVLGDGVGTSVQLTDVVVRRTVRNADRGDGIWVAGASLTGERVRTEANADVGLSVSKGGSAALGDFVSSGDFGVLVVNRGRLSLDRAWIHHTSVGALTIGDLGTMVDLADVLVTDVVPRVGASSGSGLAVLRGAAVTLTRGRFERCTGQSVEVAHAGSTLVATDLTVLDTSLDLDGEGGMGIVNSGSSLQLERVLVQNAFTAGLFLIDPQGTTSLTDVEVRETQAPPSASGLWGDGVIVVSGAVVTGTRLRLTGNHDVGLFVADAAARLNEVWVSGTELACRSSHPDCAGRVAVGVAAIEGGHLELNRFLIASNGGFGVQVATGAQLDLADGHVSFHQIGASVLDEGFDFARLEQRVEYLHNERKLSAAFVPLPRLPPPPKLP